MKKLFKDNRGSTAVGAVIGVLATLIVVLAIVVIYLLMHHNTGLEVVTETQLKQSVSETKGNILYNDAEETKTQSTVQANRIYPVENSTISEKTDSQKSYDSSIQETSGYAVSNNMTINNYYLDGYVQRPYSYGNFFTTYNYSSLKADSYFLLPNSNVEYITDDDISWLLSKGTDSNGRSYIQQAINELYARHNSVFKNSDVQNYFREYYNRRGWNTGDPFGKYDQSYVESTFNSCEKWNYRRLLEYR